MIVYAGERNVRIININLKCIIESAFDGIGALSHVFLFVLHFQPVRLLGKRRRRKIIIKYSLGKLYYQGSEMSYTLCTEPVFYKSMFHHLRRGREVFFLKHLAIVSVIK